MTPAVIRDRVLWRRTVVAFRLWWWGRASVRLTWNDSIANLRWTQTITRRRVLANNRDLCRKGL